MSDVLYKVVTSLTSNDLARQVQTLLALGWKLQGGVGIGQNESKIALYQAMTYEETELSHPVPPKFPLRTAVPVQPQPVMNSPAGNNPLLF